MKKPRGTYTCSYDSTMMSRMFIHWHIDSNNLNRPKCQADHPNFGGMEWKTQKLSVVYSTTNNNQGKNTLGWSDWQIKSKRPSLSQTLSW